MADDAPLRRHSPATLPRYVDPDVLAETRRLFEKTDVAVSEIARRMGLARSLIDRTAIRENWRRPEGKTRSALLAARIRLQIDKELRLVESQLADAVTREGRDAARQTADTLASLMRTLRELRRHDADERAAREAPGGPAQPAEDVEAARDRLAALMERLLAEEMAKGTAGEPTAPPAGV